MLLTPLKLLILLILNLHQHHYPSHSLTAYRAGILNQSLNYKSTALSKHWYFLFVMHGSFRTSPGRTPSLVRAREGLLSLVRKSNGTKLITIIVLLFNSGRHCYFLENDDKFLWKDQIVESNSTFYKITIIFFLKFGLRGLRRWPTRETKV